MWLLYCYHLIIFKGYSSFTDVCRCLWLFGHGMTLNALEDTLASHLMSNRSWNKVQPPFPTRPSCVYHMTPLAMTNIAMKNGHRNSEVSHWTWWFSVVMLVYQRVSSSFSSFTIPRLFFAWLQRVMTTALSQFALRPKQAYWGEFSATSAENGAGQNCQSHHCVPVREQGTLFRLSRRSPQRNNSNGNCCPCLDDLSLIWED